MKTQSCAEVQKDYMIKRSRNPHLDWSYYAFALSVQRKFIYLNYKEHRQNLR